MNPMIREIRLTDIPACAAILRSVYNNDLWQCCWSEEVAVRYLTDLYFMPKFLGYVLEDRGEILGAIFSREKIWWSGNEVYIEEFFVKPQHQGKGYGSRLLGQVERFVRERGLKGITLSTNRYAPAAQFYRRNGFADCGHVLYMCREM